MAESVISLAICDDDAHFRSELLRWLPSVPLPPGYGMAITEIHSGDELVRRHEAGERYDIILLDMIMPGLDGIGTAKAIRSVGDEALIICLTSSPDFALKSYRIDAFDYLIKAREMPEFAPTLAKAVAATTGKGNRRLQVKTGTTTHSVLCSDIQYIEVLAKKLSYHIVPDTILESYKSISELEVELADLPRFFKIHRSIIVNLSHVTAIDPRFVKITSSERLPVARGKYAALEEAFLRHSTPERR